ncbi:transporter [Flavobacterium rivuli WB 3.3-2 = DSM 21788]|uniref:Transporter n=1 Tax=Flavobacterium rivuli WB 3.3-2 = DSM 21788 TaxID=1121895 RepID=A0A0A2M3B1_9FLAO|nr:TolC family protein [Flavobacterium rivuli]KGO86091.1 transporter [Flavobacterium rivuli WB 3.3-2 = DSM 21788]
MHFKKLLLLLLLYSLHGKGQNLTLKEAVDTGTANYGLVLAKGKYAQAANETVKQTRRDYLPNLNLSAQQDYGTVNGQNGPLYGLGGLGVASSGLPLPSQNWNAAFGALYLVNFNWDFFTFGRMKQRITLAKADANRQQKDYEQEQFQQKVRIAGAYLNLLASQRLLRSQQKNLDRTEVVLKNAATRVATGLLPGVDSTLASAEVSRAKISLNQLKEQVKLQNNELVRLMGVEPKDFTADTTLVARIPKAMITADIKNDSLNPIRQFYQSRIQYSNEQEKLFRREYWPTFNLFGVFQTRGSGFNADYASNQNSYTKNYFDGIDPVRQNYLMGVGMIWNLTTIARSSKKVSAQKLITEGLEQEYKAVDQQLKANDDAANARMGFALQNYKEAPRQVRAAQQAYLQRTTLYNNGLTNLVDVTQALYTLNRAETDRDVIYTNVWQSLLMKAAAVGDFNLFINEF